MRRLAIALGLVAVAATPARALDFTLPGSYRALSLEAPGATPVVIKGAMVPVMWFGGPTKLFRLRFEAGGAYQTDSLGGSYSSVVGQALLSFELPLGPLIPYVGGVGHAAYTISSPSYVRGNPYGVMPQVGVLLDLGILELDVHAAQGPVWGLTGASGAPYAASVIDVGGRVAFGF